MWIDTKTYPSNVIFILLPVSWMIMVINHQMLEDEKYQREAFQTLLLRQDDRAAEIQVHPHTDGGDGDDDDGGDGDNDNGGDGDDDDGGDGDDDDGGDIYIMMQCVFVCL